MVVVAVVVRWGWGVVFEVVFVVVVTGLELVLVGVLVVGVEVVLQWVGVGMAFCGRREWLGVGGGRSLAGLLMKPFCGGSLGRSWDRRLGFEGSWIVSY